MHGHHHRRMRIRHMAFRCGGPRFGRRGIMRGFLAENPDCADKMLRYNVAWMRDEGFTEDEIRAHLEDLNEGGYPVDFDIDTVLR